MQPIANTRSTTIKTMTLDEIHQKNGRIEGNILKLNADRRPVAFILLVFFLQIMAGHCLPLWGALLAGVFSLPLLGSIATYNHHQQHHNAFNSPVMNRLFEIIIGTQTMIPSYAWVLHHNFGHHPNYLNQPPCENTDEDESRWARQSRNSPPASPVMQSPDPAVCAEPHHRNPLW